MCCFFEAGQRPRSGLDIFTQNQGTVVGDQEGAFTWMRPQQLQHRRRAVSDALGGQRDLARFGQSQQRRITRR